MILLPTNTCCWLIGSLLVFVWKACPTHGGWITTTTNGPSRRRIQHGIVSWKPQQQKQQQQSNPLTIRWQSTLEQSDIQQVNGEEQTSSSSSSTKRATNQPNKKSSTAAAAAAESSSKSQQGTLNSIKDLTTSSDTTNSNDALSSSSSSSSYDAGQITVLEGLDPVRKRPGMYIGSTGPDGLHHLVWEVIDNSVDEALAGHARLITTTIHDSTYHHEPDRTALSSTHDAITITDDGRGIPTDLHPVTGKSALETVLTVLHAGGKFNNQGSNSGYKVSGGLHGVGISVVNALSAHVQVQVDRQDKRYTMSFARGVPTGPLHEEAMKNRHEPSLSETIQQERSVIVQGQD